MTNIGGRKIVQMKTYKSAGIKLYRCPAIRRSVPARRDAGTPKACRGKGEAPGVSTRGCVCRS